MLLLSGNVIADEVSLTPVTVPDDDYVIRSTDSYGDNYISTYGAIKSDISGGSGPFDSTVTFNVKNYGAEGDGIALYDGAITSGTDDFTSASAAFTTADVGKIITISGAGGSNVDLTTTISAYVSATAVTIATNALATVSSAMAIYGTDDTTAIRNAVAAVYDGGNGPHSGIIYFPDGIYIVNGAFDQTNNSQIAVPTVDLDERPVSIVFRGAVKPHLNSRHMTGSTIFGSRYGTNGSYSIISGKNAGQSGDMTLVRIHFQDINIKTVQNPTHSALNLIDLNMASGDNVQIMANIAPGATVPIQTHNDSFGLIMPGTLNGNVSARWTALKVVRFYNGIQFGEHGQADDVMVAYGVNGLLFKDCRYTAKVGYSSVEIVVNAVVMQGLVTNYFQIDVLDLEHASGTFAPIYDLVDSTEIGQGNINYTIFDNGGGNIFARNGGKNVSLHNMETNVGIRRSTTGTQQVYEASLADSATSGGGIQLQQNDGTPVAAGTRVGKIVFAGSYATNATAGQFNAGALINAYASETFSSSSTGGMDLAILTAPTGSSTLAERMRITNDGNVGIGTTTPTNKLQIGTAAAGLILSNTGGITSAGNVGISTVAPTSCLCKTYTNGLCTTLASCT